FPAPGAPEEEQLALEIDEFERGYPRLTLDLLTDVVHAARWQSEKLDPSSFTPHWSALAGKADRLFARLQAASIPTTGAGNAASWRALHHRLWSLRRLQVFDRERDARPLSSATLLEPGRDSIVD